MTNEIDEIQGRLTAALVDTYAIESKVGEGGMALVYLATDIKHGRKVAVKVLRPELAASLGTERFLREIQLTAALSHPHILPLYDSGEADGFLFYVMPFVEGESLDAMLKREQQLSIPDAVRITREVAEALAVAHSRGLIHRDIKPDNILMTGGHAVVADFGIARAVEEAGGEKLTQTGMAVGTPAYMSPEQALGEANLDGRSDVYSLGCVLYELLVGDVPFTGPTPMAVLARHTMDNLTAPSIMRQSIPEELEDIVYCAMAKTPADRFKSAGEMAEALTALETGGLLSVRQTAAHVRQTMSHARPTRSYEAHQQQPGWKKALVPGGVVGVLAVGAIIGWQFLGSRSAGASIETGLDPRRIAVLYFEDQSSDSTLGYVADGLTEGLIDRLSAVQQFTVISKNGVAPYRGTEVTRDSVARALETGSIIAGTIEPAGGGRLRVTTRLVEGGSGAEIDRASVTLPAQNLLAAMDSVSETVSRFLRTRLGEEIRVRERRTSTTNVDAWALVQRAERTRKEAIELRSHDSSEALATFDLGDSLLVLAAEADPNWAEPPLQRGWIAYYRGPMLEDREFVAALERTIQFANEALARDPRSADALHLRGRTRFRLWREQVRPDDVQAKLLEDAQADLEASVDIDPSLAEAWWVLSILAYDLDDNFAAVRAAERSYEADAFLASQNNSVYQLFLSYYDLEQFPKAQQWCNEGTRRFASDPRFATCQLMMMFTTFGEPDVDSAWALSRRLDSIADPLAAHIGRMWVGGVLARAGLPDSARSILEAARAGRDIDSGLELAAREAVVRIILGDEDEAVDLLTRYIVTNPTHAFDLSGGDGDTHWWWRPLRNNQRFRTLATESH